MRADPPTVPSAGSRVGAGWRRDPLPRDPTVTAAALLPPLTALRLFTTWRFAPLLLGTTAAAAVGYGVAARSRPGWSRSRAVAFGAGLVVTVLAGSSFVGVYDDTLFWVRAVQNLLLLMVVPMLLALGAPLTLLAASVPRDRRPAWRRVLRSRAARLLTGPFAATVLLVAPLMVLYLTPLYVATLRDGVVSGAVGAGLVVCGFVYFWTRLRIDPTPASTPYPVTLVLTIAEMVGDAVLGIVLWLGPTLAAAYYLGLHRGWGPDPHIDQVLGAGVLWIGGDVVGLPFLGVVLWLFSREDARRARATDAELDAAEARAAELGAARTRAAEATGSDPAAEPAPSRLWWQDDPQLADRFRPRT
ncbi:MULTISPECIES: cytochrome c oxidase assembly protein [unclassified Pseudonocardia]|uniref:cytochrome c oxidase assembly protein n=1 Tax=unclassified Pseudonocardia TaxID=2619320 RepID=UPI00095D80E9|nr:MULTISPECIES: cytochrome c oxidase assembly protein [unclassified Pseudonocardia]OLM30117.1 Copper resistance protein D [Pseudonocardia sp. Ae717_Ps2]